MWTIFKRYSLKTKVLQSLNFLCLGGGSIFFFLAFSLLVSKESKPITLSLYKSYTYLFAVLIAGLVYQPHFIYSYYINYFKNRPLSFDRKTSLSLLYTPIILIFILSLFVVDVFITPFIPILFTQTLLALVLPMIAWHFSCQTLHCIFYYSRTNPNAKVKTCFRSLFFSTFIFGIFSCYIQLNDYPFYNLPIPKIELLTGSDHLLFYFRIAFLLVHICLALFSARFLTLLSLLPWASFLCWCLTVTFTKYFFYLVPLFHGLEIIPFFLRKHMNKDLIWGYFKILAISILLFFIALQVIVGVEKNLGSKYSKIFVAFLILLNFHHVILEGRTWKKSL